MYLIWQGHLGRRWIHYIVLTTDIAVQAATHLLHDTTKVFKTEFALSSFYENKVLSPNLSKLAETDISAEVPCFHKMKKTVSKMNGF